MAGEIALGGGGAVGADRGEPGGVGRDPGIVAVELGPAVEQLRTAARSAPASAEAQEHPAAFLAPLGEAGVDQDLDVARDARLALPEHLGELADRQLHRPQQREDAQPVGIGKRLEKRERGESVDMNSTYKDIFICVNRGALPAPLSFSCHK